VGPEPYRGRRYDRESASPRKVAIRNGSSATRHYARELELANEKLRCANRELEEFAYVASHDLREPLRMINIYSELLTQQCADRTSPQTEHFARHIHDGVARMEQLIQGVLQYSQVIHEGREYAVAPVPLGQPLAQALDIFGDRLNAAGARVEIGELSTVAADEMQLSLLFQNLISNSLKYAHPKRQLSLRICGRDHGKTCTTYFADNGIGFEPQFGERIFGLFKRLHGRDVPGTGLGLAICRRIVERYGGEIHARGKPQHGATFFFTLKGLNHHGSSLANLTGGG
jgi:light-regulated signal transduction histidine kinase (bacteriophytochrome)